MENYPPNIMPYAINEWQKAQGIIINISWDIICFRVLMAYHTLGII